MATLTDTPKSFSSMKAAQGQTSQKQVLRSSVSQCSSSVTMTKNGIGELTVHVSGCWDVISNGVI